MTCRRHTARRGREDERGLPGPARRSPSRVLLALLPQRNDDGSVHLTSTRGPSARKTRKARRRNTERRSPRETAFPSRELWGTGLEPESGQLGFGLAPLVWSSESLFISGGTQRAPQMKLLSSGEAFGLVRWWSISQRPRGGSLAPHPVRTMDEPRATLIPGEVTQ